MSDWTYPDDSEIPTRDGEHGDDHFDGQADLGLHRRPRLDTATTHRPPDIGEPVTRMVNDLKGLNDEQRS